MTEKNEFNNRDIKNKGGNYNEKVNGNYVQGDWNYTYNVYPQGSSKASKEDLDNRQTLLTKVNEEVTSRIDFSLHEGVYIGLNATLDPNYIEFPLSSQIKAGSKQKNKSLKNTDIIKIFEDKEINGRLLILGEPGSGKTTMLLKLAQELVKRAKESSTHPVPVLFSLASWKNDNQNIKDWLVDQLQNKVKGKNISKEWIDNQKIIPLLDGLDELATERQKKCVIKINEFIQSNNCYIVVCSRKDEYNNCKKLLQLKNSLVLHHLSEEQINNYFEDTGLKKHIHQKIIEDVSLSQLAKTPLLLRIIVLTFDEEIIEKWQQCNSSEERLSYLFDAYISKMFERPYEDEEQPKPKNTRRWLSFLACQLIEESTTDFFIEKIQPDWLKNKLPKLFYNFIVWGIIGTLILGFIDVIMLTIGLCLVLHNSQNLWFFSVPNKLLTYGLIYGLIYGLTYGLIYGLIGDFLENKIKKTIVLINQLKKISKTAISGLIVGLIIGLISGMEYWQIDGQINNLIFEQLQIDGQINNLIFEQLQIDEQINNLIFEQLLIFGLMNGFIFGLIGNKIRTVETLKFSLRKLLKSLKNRLKNWVILGLIFCIIVGLAVVIKTYMMIFIAIILLFFMAIIGLFSGINVLESRDKNFPNQGIWLSVINTITFSAVMFFLILLIIAIFQIILWQKINSQIIIGNLNSEIAFGIVVGIFTSGIPVIKHFILRVILWSTGYAPWNYAKFLNYCTERLFLQRVGGSYRFMHEQLRQHFAKSYTQMNLVPIQEIPVETSAPRVQNHIVCTSTICGHHNLANLNFCTKCGTKLN